MKHGDKTEPHQAQPRKPKAKPVAAEILDDEPRRTGRPSSYTFEVGQEICLGRGDDLISQRGTIRQVI
jgi:hypothetical protein